MITTKWFLSLREHASLFLIAIGGSLLLFHAHVDSVHAFSMKPTHVSTTVKPLFSTAADATGGDVETDIFNINIALTREVDKNEKLKEMINSHPTTKLFQDTMRVTCVELPCIGHAVGPDFESFRDFVKNSKFNDSHSLAKFDYIVITSPESANVFADVVSSDNELIANVKIAAVGKATQKSLTDLGFKVDFVPSKANGETLGEELPPIDKVKLNRVLYPASAKAEDTIQELLEKRKDASFTVTRYNTYDTVPVKLPDEQMEMVMNSVQIACFGSPSSVDAWLENIDRILGIEDKSDDDKRATPGSNGNAVAVCIGSTTAKRCLATGRWQANDIYYPKNDPGIKGWADSALQAAGDIMENAFWS